jgi:hypothetical protein
LLRMGILRIAIGKGVDTPCGIVTAAGSCWTSRKRGEWPSGHLN